MKSGCTFGSPQIREADFHHFVAVLQVSGAFRQSVDLGRQHFPALSRNIWRRSNRGRILYLYSLRTNYFLRNEYVPAGSSYALPPVVCNFLLSVKATPSNVSDAASAGDKRKSPFALGGMVMFQRVCPPLMVHADATRP